MKMEKVVVGPLQTNCYLLYEENKALIIDPGGEPEKIFSALKTTGLTQIILTHAHPDHLGALSALKNEFPQAKFLLHPKELPLLKKFLPFLKPDGFLKEGKFSLAKQQTPLIFNFQFWVFHTPGHTPGGVCLRFNDFLFTGDTLFAQGIGRTDYPYGSQKDLIVSLQKLKKLPSDLKIFPGHGPSSTLGRALEWLSGLLEDF